MARHRRSRRKGFRNDLQWAGLLTAAFLFVVVLSVLAAHPWIVVVILCALGAIAYWRWREGPRRRAAAEQDARDLIEREHRAKEEAARRDLRERSMTLGGLLALTSREFEVRVGEILTEHGYEDVEHVGRVGDLGIDLFGRDPSGKRVGIQCKRYGPGKPVRAPEVRLLYGDMTHANVGGVFVTTSRFTGDAVAYADAHGIVLVDGARLVALIAATMPEPAMPA